MCDFRDRFMRIAQEPFGFAHAEIRQIGDECDAVFLPEKMRKMARTDAEMFCDFFEVELFAEIAVDVMLCGGAKFFWISPRYCNMRLSVEGAAEKLQDCIEAAFIDSHVLLV